MDIIKIQEKDLDGMIGKAVHVIKFGISRQFVLEAHQRTAIGLLYTLRTPKSRKILHTTCDLCYTKRYMPS